MGSRKPIPKETETQVLTSSRRRCALCFGLSGDLQEKKGQIAHLDQDPSNPAFDNLAWLCFNHHDAFDGRTRQSKNYTIEEVKTYRNSLYEHLASTQTSNAVKQSIDHSYDASRRIKAVREELGLKSSQFAELLSVGSQREYEAIENGSKEAPSSLINRISEISGANVEWLKHEKGPRYNVEAIYLNPIDEDLAYCAELNPQEYFLTLDKKQLHVGLVVQTSKYRYQVLETGVTLDFWNWVDQRWAIPAFYHFLKELSDPWHDIVGISLPSHYDKLLYRGEIHFLTALRNETRHARDLLYDLLDLDHTRLDVYPYSKTYGGNWMDRAHEEFKKHLNREAGRKAEAQSDKHQQMEAVLNKTIAFQEPTQLPTYELTIVWMFPFTTVDTALLGQPEEVSRTSLHDITVTATIELVSSWDLFHPLSSTNDPEKIKQIEADHQSLKKVLFWYGKRVIESKLRTGTLQRKEKLLLTTDSLESSDRLDPSRIPEPNGFRFEI